MTAHIITFAAGALSIGVTYTKLQFIMAGAVMMTYDLNEAAAAAAAKYKRASEALNSMDYETMDFDEALRLNNEKAEAKRELELAVGQMLAGAPDFSTLQMAG